MATVQQVRVALGTSPILLVVLGVAHATALAVAVIVTLPGWAKFLAGSAIVASCVWSIYRAALLRTAQAIIELAVGEGGRLACRDRTGTWYEARILDSSVVTPWLTVLNLRVEGARFARHVVIMPDSVDADVFRRLRVVLRWSRPRSGAQREPSSNQG